MQYEASKSSVGESKFIGYDYNLKTVWLIIRNNLRKFLNSLLISNLMAFTKQYGGNEPTAKKHQSLVADFGVFVGAILPSRRLTNTI